MTLLILILLLTGPSLLLAAWARRRPGTRLDAATRGRVGLSLVLAFTAVGHFVQTEGMAAMLPPSVPYRTEIVYATGVLELLGAAGVWIPGLTRAAGLGIVLMLIGFLPVNVYAAMSHIDFGGHGIGPAYLLVRVPFQLLLIGWAWWSTGLRVPRWKPAPPATWKSLERLRC